ncbi:MAG TPA: hypothetical protein VGE93_06605 [Bryobacteraceae bacterium]
MSRTRHRIAGVDTVYRWIIELAKRHNHGIPQIPCGKVGFIKSGRSHESSYFTPSAQTSSGAKALSHELLVIGTSQVRRCKIFHQWFDLKTDSIGIQANYEDETFACIADELLYHILVEAAASLNGLRGELVELFNRNAVRSATTFRSQLYGERYFSVEFVN